MQIREIRGQQKICVNQFNLWQKKYKKCKK